MRARFWGVRGSIAAAGQGTAQVGGNTSCVEVRVEGGSGGDGAAVGGGVAGDTLIIFDAGTGLRLAGETLAPPVEAHLFLSHLHWDHIQGFPFFGPAYVPGNRIKLHAPERCAAGGDVRAALAAQMRAPHFPVGLEVMRAELSFAPVAAGAVIRIGAATVRAAAAKHPNGCLAYRVDAGGRSLVYATDTEHDAAGRIDADLLELARGADVLVYDAQYTCEEYAHKRGWGHSTAAEGARLAESAGVGQLVLYHHDPTHDDWQVARIEAATRARFPATVAAREGLTLALPPRLARTAA